MAVALQRLEPIRFELADVIADLPAIDVAPPRPTDPPAIQRHGNGDPALGLDPPTYVRVLTGRQPDREGKIACPLHEDDTPSFHAYATAERGWFCFGCRRGGSIYDLAAALWGHDTRGEDFTRLRARLHDELGLDNPTTS